MNASPPQWSDDELEADRLQSIAAFRYTRTAEPLEQYLDAFDAYRGAVENLLETTVDLSQLHEVAVDILTDPALQEALRYLAGPPISQDDLKTLAEVSSLAPSRIRTNPAGNTALIDVVLQVLDRRRFPWVTENREPTEAEKEAATLASAALMATQRVGTLRRHTSKDEQEDAVAACLVDCGFSQVATRPISSFEDAPASGEFCRETTFGSRKADLVVGLWDGRKMPIECKVSNSQLNSIKRLNNDAAQKAVVWLEEFGKRSVVPAAVVSGVFGLDSLRRAQAAGLTLFWGHGLDKLGEFIGATKTSV